MSCQNNPNIEVQGHRGCRGLLPENSLPAFEKAIKLGVHTLEMDVVITKDKKVLVSHEPFMRADICFDSEGDEIKKSEERTFNIYEMDYDGVLLYDCGSKSHPDYPDQKNQPVQKPLLKDVFELAQSLSSEVRFNIEIKSKKEYDGTFTPAPEEFVALVLEVIDNYQMEDRTNLQSFDLRTLEAIRKQAPDMKVALLVDEDEDIESKLKKLSYKPEIVSPEYKALTHDVVKNLQKNDYQVVPWTVNESDDLQTMIDFKVDAIITDYPDRLINMLKN